MALTLTSGISHIIDKIQAARTQIVFVISGGGSEALSALLEAVRSTDTVLEALVVEADAALARLLGSPPDERCSAATARAMAMVAFQSAREICATTHHQGEVNQLSLAGISCVAALASEDLQSHEHRVHIGVQTADFTSCATLQLTRGARGHAEEEHVVARLLLNQTAAACGLDSDLSPGLLVSECVEVNRADAADPWRDVVLGRRERACLRGGDSIANGEHDETARAIFPGAFNPLHSGHRQMAEVGSQLLALPVEYELSLENVDKPPLDYLDIAARCEQFDPGESLWLTRASRFTQKAELFPGATFLVGADTMARIADPIYYGGRRACLRAINQIAQRGCRFLVFGRSGGGGFLNLSQLDLPNELRQLCREVPEDTFRADISSTDVRTGNMYVGELRPPG